VGARNVENPQPWEEEKENVDEAPAAWNASREKRFPTQVDTSLLASISGHPFITLNQYHFLTEALSCIDYIVYSTERNKESGVIGNA
jgi:hypothetical protein